MTSQHKLTILLKHVLVQGGFLNVQNELSAHIQEGRANTNIFSIFKMSVNDSFLLVYLFLELCLEGSLKVLKYSHKVGELLFKIILNLSSQMFSWLINLG